MARRQSAVASHLKVAYGSWTWTAENPLLPWLAVIKAPLWKEPTYEGLRGFLQGLVASLLVKNLILVWLVSSVLGSPSLKQAQANSLQSQAVWK